MGLEKFGTEPRGIKPKTDLDEAELELLKLIEEKAAELGVNIDNFLDKVSVMKRQL